MFDFAWSEIALIAVVAMIAIGPKDMPVAMRTVGGWLKKARRMAAEFQTHVDEMVREADLGDVRSSINEIRDFDFRTEIEKAVDSDGSIRSAFATNPMETVAPAATSVEEIAVGEPPVAIVEAAEPAPPPPSIPQTPAFVPPNLLPPIAAHADAPEAPAFIPPGIAQQRHTQPSA